MTDRERAIVSAYTGYAMLTGNKIGIFYEYLEEILGRPIWTHELALESVQDEIHEKSKSDFVALCAEESRIIENLKPCPFCGGKVYIEEYVIDEPITMFEFGYQIVCKKCNCGSRQITSKLPKLLTEAEKEVYKNAVIERWNRRADDE